MSSNCCRDFTRSQILHRATAAAAGAGLPAIEPGMPAPAGTGMTRRSMMLRSLGLGLSVYGAGKLVRPELFEAGVAEAAGSTAPVIVSIFMPGGMDSMSLLAPVGDPNYAPFRPTLALAPGAGAAFGGDGRLMWHPAARPLADLHAAGKVTVVPAVGYAHADGSHFTSRHFWEVGATDANERVGWMGRYLDTLGDTNNAVQGLSLDNSLSPALATASVAVGAASSPSSYKFTSPGVSGSTQTAMMGAFGQLGRLSTSDPVLAGARQAQANSADLNAALSVSLPAPAVTYPSGSYGQRLAGLASLLAAGLPVRCATVTAPGAFDTHSSQATSLSSALQQTIDGIAAFQRDIEARPGLADRVLILLWSEFGRRAKENGSAGTDHGAGGAAFVIGKRASGQTVGEFPGLGSLDNGNLRMTTDFRSVYCSLLEQWMGADAAQIIPGAAGFARPRLVA